MIAFWVLAAVMVAGALLFVVLPLLLHRRAAPTDPSAEHGAANLALLRGELEQNDAELQAGRISHDAWQAARRDIERRALEESQSPERARPAPAAGSNPRLAIAIGILLPLAALSLYLVLGDPRALSGMVERVDTTAHALQREQIEAMVARLAGKLKAAPDDAEGWTMLGRSYSFLGRMPDAVAAYKEALQRRPSDARLLADYADALGAVTGRLEGEPEKLIARALAADPNQPKALALAGTIAFNKRDIVNAIAHWERALANLPEESGFRNMVAGSLVEAREELVRAQGTPSGATPADARVVASAPQAAKTAAAGKTVSGTVTLAPALAPQADPAATVFVFARAPEGAGPPLAVLRANASQLPLTFKLDDSMAMTPERNLSSAARVVITARVSKSGNAVPRPGDLEGASAPVAPGASGVAVRIDRVRGG